MFAIFGHGNVAGIGEALYQYRDRLPTYRAHNEQAMAHAAIAYAKAHFRRRMMACTSSIGPGATNLVTAAALAHVNRLPVLFLPGDIFVSRDPDPVLQQVEDFSDGTVSANDCFRPVSRYFDRIVHPSQLITSLPRAVFTLTDPALCGPVTLALPQDVQADAFDYPVEFFETPVVEFRAAPPNEGELAGAVRAVMAAKRPVIIAGGGVLYGGACEALREFAERHGVPVCETQAGKSSLPWDHPLQLGSVGVTGSPASNALASEADLILAVGTRLQDFTTGSNSLFTKARLVSLNVNPFDATKARGIPLRADARLGLGGASARRCRAGRPRPRGPSGRKARPPHGAPRWMPSPSAAIWPPGNCPTTVRSSEPCSAPARSPRPPTSWSAPPARFPPSCTSSGGLRPPAAITWNTAIRAWATRLREALGVKMARPDREVIVMVGDGSYLMLNNEIATSVMLDKKLIIVLLDNRGYGCINRLQQHCGGAPFNNMLADSLQFGEGAPNIDFAANAASLGALSEKVANIPELEAALAARPLGQSHLSDLHRHR